VLIVFLTLVSPNCLPSPHWNLMFITTMSLRWLILSGCLIPCLTMAFSL
jgi:hypothetical protein